MGLMRRIHANYRFVIGFNGGLIALGVAGALAPAASATLHNLSTLAVSLPVCARCPQKGQEKRTHLRAMPHRLPAETPIFPFSSASYCIIYTVARN